MSCRSSVPEAGPYGGGQHRVPGQAGCVHGQVGVAIGRAFEPSVDLVVDLEDLADLLACVVEQRDQRAAIGQAKEGG